MGEGQVCGHPSACVSNHFDIQADGVDWSLCRGRVDTRRASLYIRSLPSRQYTFLSSSIPIWRWSRRCLDEDLCLNKPGEFVLFSLGNYFLIWQG